MSAEVAMRRWGRVLAGLALVGCRREEEAADLCVEAGVLIDGTGEAPRTDRLLVVDGGRISGERPLSDRTVACAERLDASDQWVIPGLFDLHTHVALNRSTAELPYPPQYDPELSDWALRALLAWGVTTARDLGGELHQVLAQREAVATRRKPGPELLVTGPFLEGPEPFWFHPISRTVGSPSAARQAVRDLAAAGVDGVKLYASLSPAEVAAAADEARALDLFVVGDVAMPWPDLVASGLGSLEHVYNLQQPVGPADSPEADAAIAGVGDAGLAVTPTLFVSTMFRTTGDDTVPADVLARVPDRQVESWQIQLAWRAYYGLPDEVDEAAAAERGAWVRRLHEAGVPLLVGTDVVLPWMVPGHALHHELRWLSEAGVPNDALLVAATAGGARWLGVDDRAGTLVAGREADLVVLDGDPLEDITHVAEVSVVVTDGVPYTPASLLERASP